MNRIALIMPHFGHFNNYFKFWLRSCCNNPKIDFLIFTDDSNAIAYINAYGGANIKVFEMSLADLKQLFESKLHQTICLETPYKLCDFRALYGILFADYLKAYDFWGHCDNDLIFGNLSKYITDEILNVYDKILTRGHLSIYRNNPEVNEFFRKSETFEGIPSWREVVTSNRGYVFDEWAGISKMWKALQPEKVYDVLLFDDINFLKKQFLSSQKIVNHSDDDKGNFLFEYKDGSLYRYGLDKNDGAIIKEETLYVHFQKRPMSVETSHLDHYICKPNAFVNYQPITVNLLKTWGKSYLFYSQYFKIYLNKIKRKILGK